jgi:hypothetical protein
MITSHEADPDSGLDELYESPQHGEVSAENDGLVLEPEVEEIPVDQQIPAAVGDLLQELEERPFILLRSGAQVGVGHDDGVGPFHGAKYRVRLPGVKPDRRPFGQMLARESA